MAHKFALQSRVYSAGIFIQRGCSFGRTTALATAHREAAGSVKRSRCLQHVGGALACVLGAYTAPLEKILSSPCSKEWLETAAPVAAANGRSVHLLPSPAAAAPAGKPVPQHRPSSAPAMLPMLTRSPRVMRSPSSRNTTSKRAARMLRGGCRHADTTGQWGWPLAGNQSRQKPQLPHLHPAAAAAAPHPPTHPPHPTPPHPTHLQPVGQLGRGEGGQRVEPALEAARQAHLGIFKRDLNLCCDCWGEMGCREGRRCSGGRGRREQPRARQLPCPDAPCCPQ